MKAVAVPSFTDIHCHLLPGLDDGPASMEESLELARAAAAGGTGAIVATPHVRRDFITDPSDFPDRVREVEARLAGAGIPLDVHVGGELGHDMVGTLDQRDLETIAQGPSHARWLLLETPFDGLDEEVHAATDELRDRGFGVVLAHPERGRALLEDGRRDLLWRELLRGTMLQINAWSLAGGYGAEAEEVALRLLRDGLVDVVASDAHPGWRAPTLGVGLERSRDAGLDEAAAVRLVTATPSGLMNRGFVPWVPAQRLSRLSEAPSSR